MQIELFWEKISMQLNIVGLDTQCLPRSIERILECCWRQIWFVITDHRPLFPSLYRQYVILNSVSGKCFRVYIINTYQNQFLTKWNWIATNFLKFIIKIVPYIIFLALCGYITFPPLVCMYVIKWFTGIILDWLFVWCWTNYCTDVFHRLINSYS